MGGRDKLKKDMHEARVQRFGNFAFFDPAFELELSELLEKYAHGEATQDDMSRAFHALYLERVINIFTRWVEGGL